MNDILILSTAQESEWRSWLERSCQYDFYHLPSYHLTAEQMGEGEAKLVVFSHEKYFVALPVLLRPIAAIEGLERVGSQWTDATSVYGYAGPVSSHEQLPVEFSNLFQEALTSTLRKMNVIALFSRLHPLINQESILTSLGELALLGETVSIDLTLSPDAQRKQYRRDHKYGINKLIRAGVVFEEDIEWAFLDEFVEIYRDNMQRVNAEDYYMFDRSYFLNLQKSLGSRLRLFHCWFEDRIVCSGLFVCCNGIVQYHLSGTRSSDLDLSPMRLLVDGVRRWATQRGETVLHLGGGLGAQKDSLFEFKAGFSDRRHSFGVWKWVLLPHIYRELINLRADLAQSDREKFNSSGFFPAYRASK
jgi:hypothetical protein